VLNLFILTHTEKLPFDESFTQRRGSEYVTFGQAWLKADIKWKLKLKISNA